MKHYLVRITRIDPLYDLRYDDIRTKLMTRMFCDILHLLNKLKPESTIEEVPYNRYCFGRDSKTISEVMCPICGDVSIEKDRISAIVLLNEQMMVYDYGMEGHTHKYTKETYNTSAFLDKVLGESVTVMMRYVKKYMHYRFSSELPMKSVIFKIELLETLDLSDSELTKYMKRNHTVPTKEIVKKMWEQVKQDRESEIIDDKKSRKANIYRTSHDSTFICNCWVVINKRNKMNIDYNTLFSKDIKAILRNKKEADELCEKLHKIDGSDYVAYELKL
jgi:hypothetical protein